MSKRIIVLLLSSFILSSCSDGFRGYFKKSANNKWVDTKGFAGGKRDPLYNKKYITIAKKNVKEDNLDYDDLNEYSSNDDNSYDEDDQGLDISARNRLMYMKMVKADEARKQNGRYKERKSIFARTQYEVDDDYPSLSEVSKKVTADTTSQEKMQRELEQIKAMLTDAKKDLVRYKCPMEDPELTESKKKTTNAEDSSDSVENNNQKLVEEVDQDLPKIAHDETKKEKDEHLNTGSVLVKPSSI